MIKQAVYIKSITDLKDEPERLPQILLLGRSNVGKSSFINALTNRKNLARVSNTPGKTLTLNFYLIDNYFYLVDAPGYGYAKRSKTMKDQFVVMLENYLLHATELRLICMLIDFKVGPTKDDLETYDYIKQIGVDVMIIATKRDKVPNTHQFKQENLIKNILKHPKNFYAYSAVTKFNLDQIELEMVKRVKEVLDEQGIDSN
ncbi:MAG: ribosome biogenesis GTP-binding protein YihA/YsxC [Acholeplasmataceae bacterium]|nr:ribosome biogenesis GTP-binding protein YihA/YsxC [Acholeplasmataceae bacterium]